MRSFKTGLMFICFVAVSVATQGQAPSLTGRVIDATSRKALPYASISIFRQNRNSGTLSNSEGGFIINEIMDVDSINISQVGYVQKSIYRASFKNAQTLIVALQLADHVLPEVVVQSLSAREMVERAIASSKAMLPNRDYENKFFYREIIKDKETYFSVAEVVFKGQYDIKDRSVKLEMLKGRRKANVSYTRLFESYHPGGGPLKVAEKSLSVGFPAFLQRKKLHLFTFEKGETIEYDGTSAYVIYFDQRPGIHKSLDRGKIIIRADDYTLLHFEAENSPLGMPYKKDLAGTDKLFAELLHIDFDRKAWSCRVDFAKKDGRLVLRNATAAYNIGYREPKKNLDLDLTITTEMVATDPLLPLLEAIPKISEWQPRNLTINLPTDFQPGFWGSYDIISPSAHLDSIIALISSVNKDSATRSLDPEWKSFKKDLFVASQASDTITLIPTVEAGWEDDATAGMIFREIKSDFSVESSVRLSKNSNLHEFPDKGFQQSGLIIRGTVSKAENNIILCIGTGGNRKGRLFLRKTEEGRTKGQVIKIDSLHCQLKFEKSGSTITAFYRLAPADPWKTMATYQMKSLTGELQVGLMAMARFAGHGPNRRPDIRGIFTGLKIVTH